MSAMLLVMERRVIKMQRASNPRAHALGRSESPMKARPGTADQRRPRGRGHRPLAVGRAGGPLGGGARQPVRRALLAHPDRAAPQPRGHPGGPGRSHAIRGARGRPSDAGARTRRIPGGGARSGRRRSRPRDPARGGGRERRHVDRRQLRDAGAHRVPAGERAEPHLAQRALHGDHREHDPAGRRCETGAGGARGPASTWSRSPSPSCWGARPRSAR